MTLGKAQKDQTQRTKTIVAAARKMPLNFAALQAPEGVMFFAEKQKSISALKGQAKSAGGGSKGGWGTLSIEGGALILDCENAPPSSLARDIRALLKQAGHNLSVSLKESGQEGNSSENAPPSGQEAESRQEEEDSEEDLAAEMGDVSALLKAVLKKTYFFAMLVGPEGLVLKTHRRKPAAQLVKLAKKEGTSSRGAWGLMNREGRELILTCENEPAKPIARMARQHFKDRGHSLKVILRTPSGDIVEDEAVDETQGLADPLGDLRAQFDAVHTRLMAGAESGAVDAKKVSSIVAVFEAALKAEDNNKAQKLIMMLERMALELPKPEAVASTAPTDPPGTAPDSAPVPQSTAGGKPSKTKKPVPLGDGIDGAEADEPSDTPGRAIPVVVKVSEPMGNLEFSNLVDTQVHGLSQAEAEADNANPENRVQPLDFEVTQEDAEAGYVVVLIIHPKLEELDALAIEAADDAFDNLTPEEQDQINQQADEMFWKVLGLEEGHILDPSEPGFDELAKSWKAFRADMIAKRGLVEALPPRVFDFMSNWDGGAEILPEHYDAVLLIAEQLASMSDAQLADYMNRVEGRTNDPVKVLLALRQYNEEQRAKVEACEERIKSQDKLTGQEKLYETYLLSKETMDLNALYPEDRERNERIQWARDNIDQMLIDAGYVDEDAFEKAMEEFTENFRDEAVTLADDAMDYAENAFYEYENALTDDKLSELMAELRPMQEVVDREETGFGNQVRFVQVSDLLQRSPELRKTLQLLQQGDPNFPPMAFVNLLCDSRSNADLKAGIQEMLDARREAIDETRERLKDDPDVIWEFDVAIARGRSTMNVGEEGLLDTLVDEEKKKHDRWKTGRDITLAIGAMLAGFFAGGPAGAGAAAGAVVGGGIAAAEAWIAFTEYQAARDGNLAGLSSTKPELAWAVLSMMPLPFDAFDLGKGLKVLSKAGKLQAISDIVAETSKSGRAIAAFNKELALVESADDATKALAKLEKDLVVAEDKVYRAILRAARAEAAAKASWAAARKEMSGKLRAVVTGVELLAEYAYYFAYPVCNSLRKGSAELSAILKTKRLVDLQAELGDISVKRMEEIKSVVTQIKKADWPKIRAKAVELNMDEEAFSDAFKVWSKHPEMDTDEFIDDVLTKAAKEADSIEKMMDGFDLTFDEFMPVRPGEDDISKRAVNSGLPSPQPQPGRYSRADTIDAVADALNFKRTEITLANGNRVSLTPAHQAANLIDLLGEPVSKRLKSTWDQAVSQCSDVKKQMEEIERLHSLGHKVSSKQRAAPYNAVRDKFWELVDANKVTEFREAGLQKGERAPFLQIEEGSKKLSKHILTLEHFDRKVADPTRVIDPDNLIFSFGYENSVVLEMIRRIIRNAAPTGGNGPHPWN